jgi:hypothetical protein
MVYVSVFGLSGFIGFPFAQTEPVAQITVDVYAYNGSVWVPQMGVKVWSYNLSSVQGTRVGLIETRYSDSTGMCVYNYAEGAYEFEAEWPPDSGIKNSTRLTLGAEPYMIPPWHVGIGPSPPFDFMQWLTDLLNQPYVRNDLMYGGIGFIGLGSILFIIPRKKS